MTSDRPEARRPASTQLLVDLVMNTRDPGYAAAAERRGDRSRRPWYEHAAVAGACVLLGFLLMVAYLHTHRGAPAAAKVHDSLVARVQAAERQDASLSAELSAVDAQLTAAQDRALPASGALVGQLHRDQALAGQLAVHGPGLEVELSDPPRPTASAATGRGGTTPIAATNILTDRDVRSVVNELWADGAEAIAVNGVRLTPVSAIRFAGEAVLVDFQPITSPYLIRAIGNANDLATGFAASDVASRYQTLSSAEGIGFTFRELATLSLPAGAPTTLRYAREPVPSAPSPSSSGAHR